MKSLKVSVSKEDLKLSMNLTKNAIILDYFDGNEEYANEVMGEWFNDIGRILLDYLDIKVEQAENRLPKLLDVIHLIIIFLTK